MNLDNFEDEFMTDEEDEELDEEIEQILSLYENEEDSEGTEESRVLTLEPLRTKSMLCAFKIIKHITKGTKAKVTYTLNEPYVSMGGISITGKDLTFKNPKGFMVAVKLASNFNIYTKLNGDVQIDLTFHNLTMPIV